MAANNRSVGCGIKFARAEYTHFVFGTAHSAFPRALANGLYVRRDQPVAVVGREFAVVFRPSKPVSSPFRPTTPPHAAE